MKKLFAFAMTLVLVLSFTACSGGQSDYDIKIVIPAGSQEDFVYSEVEISPLKDTITISSGEGLGDTEVHLIPVQVNEETEYTPTYLTPGMPVKMTVEKGAWYKIGISVQNPTDEDIIEYVNVGDIDVRTE